MGKFFKYANVARFARTPFTPARRAFEVRLREGSVLFKNEGLGSTVKRVVDKVTGGKRAIQHSKDLSVERHISKLRHKNLRGKAIGKNIAIEKEVLRGKIKLVS